MRDDETTLNYQDIDFGQLASQTGEDILRNQQRSQLNVVLPDAMKRNPQEEAKLQGMAEKSKLPVDAVRIDPSAVETRLKYQDIDFDALVEKNPKLTKYLSDPANASIAHNDIDNLREIENAITPKQPDAVTGNMFTNLGESLGLSAQGMYQGLKQRFLDNSIENMEMIRQASGGQLPTEQTWFQELVGIPSAAEQQKEAQGYIDATIKEIQAIEKQQAAIMPTDLNIFEKGARAGLESMVMNLPGIAATIATRGQSSLPALGTMAVQSYAASYGAARAGGLDARQADYKASIDASLEVATEVAPLKILGDIVGGEGGSVVKKLRDFALTEMAGEQVATLTQSLNDYAFGLDDEMNKAEGWQEVLAIQAERQAITAIATVVAGSAQGGIASTINKIKGVQTEQTKKILKGMREQEDLAAIAKYSEKSELRKNDKEKFKQYVRGAEGDNGGKVFIDSAELKKYLTETEGLDPDEPIIAQLLQLVTEADALNQDVAIPIEDFAADMAGTPHYEALKDSMTMSEDTVSPMQKVKRGKEQQNYVKGLIAEAEQNASEYVEAQEIYETVRQQLVDTGMVTPQNAKYMADVVPAWAASYAVRQGITVKEAYDRSGLLIEGPQTGEAARLAEEASLLQAAFREGNTIFDRAKSDFLDAFPEDAEFDEVMDNLDDVPKIYHPLFKALDREGWLGYDFPSQALNSLISEDADLLDLPNSVKQALGRLVNVTFDPNATFEQREFAQATAKGLDMSQEGRMARAEEMGFDTETTLYHGTPDASFESFKIGGVDRTSYSGDVNGAGVYLTDNKKRASNVYGIKGAVIPAYTSAVLKEINDEPLSAQEVADINNYVSQFATDEMKAKLGDESFDGMSSGQVFRKLANTDARLVSNAMMAAGYEGVKLPNGDRVIYNTAAIRSTNAAFDPDFVMSSDLLAQTAEIDGFINPAPEEFTNLVTTALGKSTNGLSASIYPVEEYANMDLYTTDEGRAGFAIQDGYLMSVFKDPESTIKGFKTLMPAAIKAGAVTLDAFEGPLTENYAKYGFEEISRVPWDDQYAPEGWNYETQGRPDLVKMKLKDEVRYAQTGTNEKPLQDGRGVQAGDGRTQQRNGTGRGSVSPLQDAPSVEGINGPIEGLVRVAEQYAADNGIDLKRQGEYVEVDPERATRIAQAYEQMENAPNDPVVREAYENLIRQTKAQYDALVAAGYSFWFVDLSNDANLDYISSPWNAMRDAAQNKQMGVFPTNEGFGTDEAFDPSTNPLLADTGLEWPIGGPNGEMAPVMANDLFRAVHDAFGHGLEGAGFRARGEENAWQAHVRLFTGSAVGAITSETRGQNSWVNYGPDGEQNQTASAEETVFADQKVGLMPDWTWKEGVAPDDVSVTDRVPGNPEDVFYQTDQGMGEMSEYNRTPPQNTVKAYKLFRVDPSRPGELFPLFVNAGQSVPVGTWIDAEKGDGFSFKAANGREYIPSSPYRTINERTGKMETRKTGASIPIPDDATRAELIKRGFLPEGSNAKNITGLALRAGWHAGDSPTSKHLGSIVNPANKAPDTRTSNQVWAEVEMPADKDWQAEVLKNAPRTKQGKVKLGEADMGGIPTGGHYRYKTNPNMEGEWVIGGALKVTRVLNDSEVQAMNAEMGREDLPRPEGFAFESADEFNPPPEDALFQTASIMRGEEDLSEFGVDKNQSKPKAREAAVAFDKRQQEKYGGIDPKDFSDEAVNEIAGYMVEEIQFEMQNPKDSGLYWYSQKFPKALDILAARFPELATDEEARGLMTAIIAITSDGQEVQQNLTISVQIYEQYKETGKIVQGAMGSRRDNSGKLAELQELFDLMGDKEAIAWLLDTSTVKEIKARVKAETGKLPSNIGYSPDTVVNNSVMMLGDKLGAFFANLSGLGNDIITMDMWWMRSINRMRGNLIPVPIGLKGDEYLDKAKTKKKGVAKFKELLGKPRMSDELALENVVKYALAYKARDFKKSGKEKQDKLEAAANSIYKRVYTELNEKPAGPGERTFMLNVVNKVQQDLAAQGIEMDLADIQAVMWYYEKKLWNEVGVRPKGRISYEEAAIKNLEGAGIRPDGPTTPDGLEAPDTEVFNQTVRQNQGVTKGYYSPGESLIRLTRAADESTFLHEFAHFMYEMELTASRNNPDKENHVASIHSWYKRNGEEVLKEAAEYAPNTTIIQRHLEDFLDNGTSGDPERDSAIRRAVHEQFARGFEKYLMEGVAPSVELRNAFRSFARWITEVYRNAKGFFNPENIQLDDGIRKIYDRLLATDEQIAAAEARAEYAPMFTDAAMAGMTDAEYEKYKAKQEKVKEKQTETLRDKVISQLTRMQKAWWKDEMQDEVDAQTDELQNETVYLTRDGLKNGEVKLDHATVKDIVGEDITNKRGIKSRRIPTKLNGMTAKGGDGLHPDEAAALFGYESGSEMLTDLMEAPPIAEVAQERAEAAMVDRHGDIMNDGTIEAEADAAIMDAERGALLLLELKALSKGSRTPSIDRATMKFEAEANIAKLSFKDIHPGKYRKAEIKAAQESAAMLAKGDREGAKTAKTRQVMNFYLNKAATEARADTLRRVEGMARYNKKAVRERIMRAENGYWEQVVKILQRFEFRKAASMKGVDAKNQAIEAWMNERIETDGDGLMLTPEVLDELYTTHWKNVPYSELKGITDSVKNIEHVARYADKMRVLGEEITFKKLVNQLVTHINANNTKGDKFKSQRTDVKEGRSWGRMAMAQMTKVPFLMRWLDGGENGGLSFNTFSQPFTDAYRVEVDLMTKHGEPVMKLIEGRSKEDQKRHARKVFIPELKDENNNGNLYGNQIVAVALNVGNAGNLRKMLLGEGWASPDDPDSISINNPQLQAVLGRMSKSDWELVQSIWDEMDALYPQLADVHRRTTGLTPPKVEAEPVETPYGTFKGGYFPVKYDANRSQKAQDNEDKLNAQTESMFSTTSSIQANVTAGATNERTEYYAPIRLSLDVVPSHFQETIHFISHHDAVRQVNKLLRNPQIAKAMTESVGPEEFAMLKPWLNDIAKDGRESNTKLWWEDALARLRFGTTLASMGFSASTGLLQFLGWSNIVAEVGPKYTFKAVKQILGSPATMREAWDFASENSKILKNRMTSMDREIKNAMNRINTVQQSTGNMVGDAWARFDNSNILKGVQEASMKHIGYIQTYMVDLPTWYAAYMKELESSGDEAKAYRVADFTVESIQGSGLTKDLPTILRTRNEANRMFTMFMTFFSALWNMERDLVKGAKAGTYSKTQTAAKLMFLFTIPVAVEMLVRGEFGEEDDEPEDKLQKYLMKTALYSAASIPFARDVASGIGGEFGYTMTPLAGVLERGIGSSKALTDNALSDGDITMSQAKNTSKFVGTALGIPGTGQIWKTTEHLYEVLEEGEDLTARELLLGPDREKK